MNEMIMIVFYFTLAIIFCFEKISDSFKKLSDRKLEIYFIVWLIFSSYIFTKIEHTIAIPAIVIHCILSTMLATKKFKEQSD